MDLLSKGFAYFLADVLSIVTILMCLVGKVPQIKTLYSLKSAAGLSLLALYLEISSYTTTLCYNWCNGYSLLSYLEYPILIIQDYVLLFLAWKYKDMLHKDTYIAACIYTFVTLLFMTKVLPSFILTFLVPLCTPIGATSKVIQLLEIIRTKNSKSVSLMTWFISAFTNLTRAYTIWMDSADMILLSNFGISCLLSSAVYVAAYVYKKPKYR